MANDFYTEVARQRALELDADMAEINAGLARAKAEGDDHSARQLIQGLANARAERRNLEIEYQQYVASQQPRQPAPATDGEWMMRPADKMTGEDVDRIFAKSKFYTPGMWSERETADRVNAGLAEVERRRRMGQ
jgi:hypothetical protein